MDETERFRRELTQTINHQVESEDVAAERKRLEEQHGQVWDTDQLRAEFEVIGFLAPFVGVRRLADGAKGSMAFQHHPRFYFSFMKE